MLSILRSPSRWLAAARPPAESKEQAAELRFAALADAHLDAIYRTARRLGARSGDVEDLVQEVLVVLARRLGDIEPGKERAFALATVARVASEFRRRERRRREELVAELDGETRLHAVSSVLPAGGEQGVEHAEALELLRAGLEAMTEAQRVTFVLFELEELRAAEIAAELGVAEAAVVSRLQRARTVMRRVCERHGRAARLLSSQPDQEYQP